MEILVFS